MTHQINTFDYMVHQSYITSALIITLESNFDNTLSQTRDILYTMLLFMLKNIQIILEVIIK